MIEKHVEPGTLELLFRRKLSPEEVVRLGLHLWTCEACRAAVKAASPWGAKMLDQLFQTDRPAPERTSSEGRGGYGGVFDRLQRRMEARSGEIEHGLSSAPRLLADLLSLPPSERTAAIRSDPRFTSRPLAELLLERCRESWGDDPLTAQSLIDLAREVLVELDADAEGRAPLEDLHSQCWAATANIRRILSDLRSSEAAFEQAEDHLKLGTGDPVTRGELLALKSSLRRDQRHLKEALRLLNQAAAAFHKAGDPHLLGRALLKKALVYNDQGKPNKGLSVLRKAIKHIDAEREPRLRLAAQEQLVLFLNQAGRPWEALALLPEAHRTAREVGTRLDRLRVLWVEGLIALDLSDFERAEEALLAVRAGFIEESIGYDAALVSLDLASLYLRQGRAGETRQLAVEMLPIFQSRDLHREALAALMVFRRAVEIETVTLGMVEDISTYLKQARRNPDLAFETPS